MYLYKQETLILYDCLGISKSDHKRQNIALKNTNDKYNR